MIVPLGEWVIRQACADAAQWAGDACVAVNLSPTQLINKNLLPAVLGALASAQLSADRLELEITEAVLMQTARSRCGCFTSSGRSASGFRWMTLAPGIRR